jgi:hypothetical protein
MAESLDVPYRVETETGDVAATLRKFAKQWRADVVVVGRGRRTNRWQFGANIGDIIERSPCPVITVSGGARLIRPHGRRDRDLAKVSAVPRDAAFIDGVPHETTVKLFWSCPFSYGSSGNG